MSVSSEVNLDAFALLIYAGRVIRQLLIYAGRVIRQHHS